MGGLGAMEPAGLLDLGSLNATQIKLVNQIYHILPQMYLLA